MVRFTPRDVLVAIGLMVAGLPPAASAQEVSSEGVDASAHDTATLRTIREDPPPPELILSNHYWVSNELAHWVWRDAIADLGGALVGVGTDQLYLLAGWSRATVVIPMDFDGDIALLHRAYGAAFLSAESPDAFIALWEDAALPELNGAVREAFPERDDETLAVLERARQSVRHRLRRERERYADRGLASVWTDQATYDHVRGLWQRGAVYPIRGDLTGDATMVDIGAALRDADVPLRVLYLSNAEVYFDYTDGFRRNIGAQYVDERSVVLRTRHTERFGNPEGDEDYHYMVQSAEDFACWMASTEIPNMWRLLSRHREDTDTVGLSGVEPCRP